MKYFRVASRTSLITRDYLTSTDQNTIVGDDRSAIRTGPHLTRSPVGNILLPTSLVTKPHLAKKKGHVKFIRLSLVTEIVD